MSIYLEMATHYMPSPEAEEWCINTMDQLIAEYDKELFPPEVYLMGKPRWGARSARRIAKYHSLCINIVLNGRKATNRHLAKELHKLMNKQITEGVFFYQRDDWRVHYAMLTFLRHAHIKPELVLSVWDVDENRPMYACTMYGKLFYADRTNTLEEVATTFPKKMKLPKEKKPTVPKHFHKVYGVSNPFRKGPWS